MFKSKMAAKMAGKTLLAIIQSWMKRLGSNLTICAQKDNVHLKIVLYMHFWAQLNHYSSPVDTLGHFWALLGPFGPFCYEEPL